MCVRVSKCEYVRVRVSERLFLWFVCKISTIAICASLHV